MGERVHTLLGVALFFSVAAMVLGIAGSFTNLATGAYETLNMPPVGSILLRRRRPNLFPSPPPTFSDLCGRR